MTGNAPGEQDDGVVTVAVPLPLLRFVAQMLEQTSQDLEAYVLQAHKGDNPVVARRRERELQTAKLGMRAHGQLREILPPDTFPAN
ncbi:MAG: hypothetical protein KI788_15840 [Mameliella sp.]|nr:hypothetical protein [Mameliella sp.]